MKEGTSAVLLHSGLDEKWRADSMECYCLLRNVQDLLADGRTPDERRFGEPFKGPIIGSINTSPIWQESVTKNLSWVCINRGLNLERRYSDCGSARIGKDGHVRCIDITKGRSIHVPSSRWYSKIVRKRLRIPRTHSKAGTNRKE